MICSFCYKHHVRSKHDVSSWWNNPEGHVHVCSDECRDNLKVLLDKGTWMSHKPKRIFGKADNG